VFLGEFPELENDVFNVRRLPVGILGGASSGQPFQNQAVILQLTGFAVVGA
jgi:hypothetical protein